METQVGFLRGKITSTILGLVISDFAIHDETLIPAPMVLGFSCLNPCPRFPIGRIIDLLVIRRRSPNWKGTS
jgi:uncharacterized membrane protein